MLQVATFDRIDDVAIHQDDADWTLFYPVPSKPRIRRDEQGRPIFLLSIFHTSDQDREAKPDLPKGGGYMNFDVELAVEKDVQQRAIKKLQQWVDEEYARRRADPAYAGKPDYADATPPKARLTDPLLSGGSVKMLTTQSGQLVTGKFAETPASLVSGSAAVFNMDLSETGASFMKELFVDSSGSGRIDLSPVQVIYDLRMWARMPPITITVSADSQRVQKSMQSLTQKEGDNVCTPAEIETFRETSCNSASLHEAGVIEVIIDKQDATVPDEVLAGLQEYALGLFDTMMAERFLAPADAEPDAQEPLEFDEPMSAMRRPAGVRFRPWISKRWRSPTTRYKMREMSSESSMKLEIKVERSQVIEWPTGGQATLETFFSDDSPEEIRRHVVDVRADEFDSLGVMVRAICDFEKQALQAVEIQTEYSATDEHGDKHVVPGSFTFRAGETATQRFDPSLIGRKREYRYRYRVIYDDGSATEYTPWSAPTIARDLNVAVANPGQLALEVSGASLNWEVLRGVRVDLSYGSGSDASNGALQKSFELNKLVMVRKWEQQFNHALEGEVTAKLTYFLTDDKVVEGVTQTVDPSNNLLLIPPPQVDVLNVMLLPTGNWSDVAQAVVQLKYKSADGRIYDKTFRFTAPDQSAEWTVLLRDPTQRTFSYQTVAAYKSGGSEESPWKDVTGDQTLRIEVKGVPRLRVNVLPNLVDFTRTPAVQVTLAYQGERKTLAFTGPQAQSWEVPLAADGARDYSYEITWHPASGDSVQVGPIRSVDTELFVPRAKLPTTGKLEVTVRGFAVDYAVTPFVDVALVWRDDPLEERKTLTLSKEATVANWAVDIGDRTQRRYHYAVTYNLADGRRVEGPSGDSDDPVISITRHQP